MKSNLALDSFAAGHVSRAMLSRYSHVRMEAKRRALDEIASRQRAADEKRKAEAERREQPAAASQSAVIQLQHTNTAVRSTLSKDAR